MNINVERNSFTYKTDLMQIDNNWPLVYEGIVYIILLFL